MKEINLWESGFAENFNFTNNIDDLIKVINEGNNISIKDKYSYGDKASSFIESKLSESNASLIYTDSNHSIAIPKNSFLSPVIVSSEFFNNNRDKIIKAQMDLISDNSSIFVNIYNYMFSDELFEKIITNRNKSYNFYDINLTQDQIKRLNENYIDAWLYDDTKSIKISDKYVISYYTLDDMKELHNIFISHNISDYELSKINNIDDKIEISIDYGKCILPTIIENEEEYYEGVLRIVNKLNEFGKKNLVIINVQSRNIFNKYKNLLANSNVFIIEDGINKYTYEQYIQEEEKLDKMVEEIKDSKFSPFEKFLYIYNIVKNFKKYNEIKDGDKMQSRSLKYILNNEYIVCVGFSNLLRTLLQRVGINSTSYDCGVDISQRSKNEVENKPVEFGWHSRLMFYLKDEKYNIDGYYISDPTWDNMNEQNLFNHAIITYESMQVSNLNFTLQTLDYIFDVKDFQEYCKKINALFKKQLPQNEKNESNTKLAILKTYSYICQVIMETLFKVDKDSYKEVREAYLKAINSNDERRFNKCQNAYNEFLTIVGKIVVSKSNKKISNEKLVQGLASLKRQGKLNVEYTEDELLENHEKRDVEVFPYENSEGENLIPKEQSKKVA